MVVSWKYSITDVEQCNQLKVFYYSCGSVISWYDSITGVEQCKVEESQLMLEAMNGFLLLLDRKKKILYVSDGVATHLGIDQVSVALPAEWGLPV